MQVLTIRVSKDLHEKLRWLSFTQRKSQNAIIVEALKEAFKAVEVPPSTSDVSMRATTDPTEKQLQKET